LLPPPLESEPPDLPEPDPDPEPDPELDEDVASDDFDELDESADDDDELPESDDDDDDESEDLLESLELEPEPLLELDDFDDERLSVL
jgi:hypothetical protein